MNEKLVLKSVFDVEVFSDYMVVEKEGSEDIIKDELLFQLKEAKETKLSIDVASNIATLKVEHVTMEPRLMMQIASGSFGNRKLKLTVRGVGRDIDTFQDKDVLVYIPCARLSKVELSSDVDRLKTHTFLFEISSELLKDLYYIETAMVEEEGSKE